MPRSLPVDDGWGTEPTLRDGPASLAVSSLFDAAAAPLMNCWYASGVMNSRLGCELLSFSSFAVK
jgi:hypothetical protein